MNLTEKEQDQSIRMLITRLHDAGWQCLEDQGTTTLVVSEMVFETKIVHVSPEDDNMIVVEHIIGVDERSYVVKFVRKTADDTRRHYAIFAPLTLDEFTWLDEYVSLAACLPGQRFTSPF